MAFHSDKMSVQQSKVEIPGSHGAYIQWLVTKDQGSTKYALRRFVIHSGGLISLHKHAYEETVFVLSGAAEVTAGDERMSLGAGEYVFIPGNMPHSIENSGSTQLEFLCVIPYIQDMSITPLSQ